MLEKGVKDDCKVSIPRRQSELSFIEMKTTAEATGFYDGNEEIRNSVLEHFKL